MTDALPLHWIEERVVDGVTCREFDVVANGRTVPGAWWPGEPGKPLLCFGHGASSDRHQIPIPSMARRMAREHGFHGLAIDGPVHGRRQRGPGGRAAFEIEWRREASEADMTADWRAVPDAILAEAGGGPVGYWGLSMGTVYGLPLVSAEPRMRAAVLGLMGIDGLTGFTGPPELRARVTDAATGITCPVLFLQQLDDELVPRDSALALFDTLASQDKRLHANAGGHVEVPVEEIEAGLAFLAHYLEGHALPRQAAFAAPPTPAEGDDV